MGWKHDPEPAHLSARRDRCALRLLCCQHRQSLGGDPDSGWQVCRAGWLHPRSDHGTRLAEGKEDCLVLDFAGNTARHGPIDTVDGRKKEKSEDPGTAPIKVCPECNTINHASVRRCIECDYEFPPPAVKVAPRAASNALLSTQVQAEWCDVTGISYARHEKPGKPASLRVTYECGLARHSEWVCFEHTGFPREKAVSWWRKRASDLPPPATVDEALGSLSTLRRPIAIQVRPAGQYTEITAARFG